MNASELRIGNWVKNLGLDVKIEGYGIAFCAEGKLVYDPIPLTPEILEKCGFGNGNSEKANVDLWNKYWIGDFELDNNKECFDYEGKVSIKYLHQLQNLYFALTGEELKITL